jgi:hypothetical protein
MNLPFGFHLTAEAPDWHKLWSVRLSLIGALYAGLWMAVPAFQAYIPPFTFAALAMSISIGVIVSRLIDQPNVPTRGDPNV